METEQLAEVNETLSHVTKEMLTSTRGRHQNGEWG